MRPFLSAIALLVSSLIHAQSIKEEYRECAINFELSENFDSALVYYTYVIELDSLDSSAYFDRGMLRDHLIDFVGALEDFTRQLSIDSTNVDSYFLRGIVNDKLGNDAQANSDYTKVLELEESNADAHFFRGRNKFEAGDFEGSMIDFTRAIELNPDNAIYFYERAILSLEMNKKTEACEDYHIYSSLTTDENVKRLPLHECD